MARRTLHAGSQRMEGLGLNLFTKDELYDIHLATMDVLWNTGVRIESDEALHIMEDNGCIVNWENKICKIPEYIVDQAINLTPGTVRCCGREERYDYIAGGNRTGFLNFGEAVKIIDPYTKEHRKGTREDVANITRFVDSMDQVVCYERALSPSEANPHTRDVHNVEIFLNNTKKHGFIGLAKPINVRAACKMGAVVAGGKEAFRMRPLFSTTTDPISPLTHTKDASESLIEACKWGLPSKVNPISLPGGTSCVNIASTMINVNAEILSMFVLAQICDPGHPLIYGSSTGIMDLKTGLASFGCPELALMSAATAKLAQFYGFPSWVGGG